MSKMNQVYGIGQALISSLPPPQFFENAPTSTQTNFEIGQIGFTGTAGAYTFYIYAGAGVWELLDIATGALDTLTGDSGTAVPTAGNIKIAGTANQVATTASGSTVTLSLVGPYTPATYTAHGVLIGEGTSSIVATTPGTDGQVLTGNTGADPSFATIGTKSGLTAHGVIIGEGTSAFAATAAGTAGQLLTSGGASADPVWTTATFPSTAGGAGTILRSNGTNYVASTDTWPDTVVAGDILVATSANTVGSLADVATGQVLVSGGVSGQPAYSASPTLTGSITLSTAGTGVIFTSSQNSGAASGPVVVNGRSGRATFTSVSIAAAADLTLTITNSSITGSTTEVLISMSGATTGSALSIKSKTAMSGSLAIVVTNGTGATTTTDDIQIDFLVLNA